MTRRRWIADESAEDRAALIGDNARHLAQVLRARVGEKFDIAANGRVRLGTVTVVSDARVEFALGEDVAASTQTVRVELLLAVFKFDRMEWAVEKATELGVTAILPVIARRTDAHLATAAAKRVERWRKIAKEAAQQSRRADVPEIADPVKLKAAVEAIPPEKVRIVLSEEEKAVSLAEVLSATHEDVPIFMAVGPEGGWTPEELRLFAERGWKSASMGATILRAETAAIAAIAIVNSKTQ